MASSVHEKWTFQPLSTKQFASLEASDFKELLMKWYEQRYLYLSDYAIRIPTDLNSSHVLTVLFQSLTVYSRVLYRNLDVTMQAKCFYYDKHFQAYQKDGFCRDFFIDPVVNSTLQVRCFVQHLCRRA